MMVTIAIYRDKALSVGVSGLLFFLALKINVTYSDYLIGG